MDRSKIIWGIICMFIAAGLMVANLTLPPDKIMFQVGDQNLPWAPPGVLAVLGVILLATAGRVSRPDAELSEAVVIPEKAALNKRLEAIAWGLFLIMLGGFMFVPEAFISGGWWSIGVGLIMLGLNAARYFNELKMSGFTTFLGVLSVISGTLEVAGVYDLQGAILLIILGAFLLVRPYVEKQKIFGKAEEA